MRQSLVFLLFAIFSIACSQNTMLSAEETAIFELQKTPCYGTCPVYTLRLAKDGRASLEAEKFIEKEGLYRAKFAKNEVKTLIEEFEAANFKDFEDKYTSEMSDKPTTYVTFRDKRIMNYDNAPQALKELEKLLTDLVDRPEWEKVTAEK